MSHQNTYLMAGVIGWPVMHSRSPLMHNYWMQQQGLTGVYVPLAIEPEGLAAALRALHPLGFAGCNLTIPHKQEAMAIVDEVDEVARVIGAISCVVVRPDGSLYGTNNDWLGFMGNLKQQQPEWKADAGPVAVIGGGGGARAICYGLLQAGVKELRLVNRTHDRALAIAEELGGPIEVLAWKDRNLALEGATMCVNVTSQGMVGQPALDLKLDLMPKSAIANDIIYTPQETPFLANARERGNPTVNGLGMLLHQGRPAWKFWFGIEPDVSRKLQKRMEQSIVGG